MTNKYGKVIYPDSHKLFVGNLFKECREELLELFSPYGEVTIFKHSQTVKIFGLVILATEIKLEIGFLIRCFVLDMFFLRSVDLILVATKS